MRSKKILTLWCVLHNEIHDGSCLERKQTSNRLELHDRQLFGFPSKKLYISKNYEKYMIFSISLF